MLLELTKFAVHIETFVSEYDCISLANKLKEALRLENILTSSNKVSRFLKKL